MAMDINVQFNMAQLNGTLGQTQSASSNANLPQFFQPGLGQTPMSNFFNQMPPPGANPFQQGANPFLQLPMPNGMSSPQMQMAGQMMQFVGQLMGAFMQKMQGLPQTYGQMGGGYNTGAQHMMQDLMHLMGDAEQLGEDAENMQQGFGQMGGAGGLRMLQDLTHMMGDAGQLAEDAVNMQRGGTMPQPNPFAGFGGPNPFGGQTPGFNPFGPGSQMPVGGTSFPGGQPQQMDDDQALRIIDRNFDKLSGGGSKFTTNDLKRAASDSSNPQLQQAAQYMLDHKSFMNGIDQAQQNDKHQSSHADGIFSRRDVATALQDTGNAAGDENVMSTLQKYSQQIWPNGKGLLSKAEVQRMAEGGTTPSGEQTPPELQAAARNLLSKPELFDKLDAAKKAHDGKGGQLDGQISLKDLNIAQNESRRGTGETAPPRTPFDVFGSVFGDALTGHLSGSNIDPGVLSFLQPGALGNLLQTGGQALNIPGMFNDLGQSGVHLMDDLARAGISGTTPNLSGLNLQVSVGA